MSLSKEAIIENALKDLERGESMRKTAKKFGISRTTLLAHRHGGISPRESHEDYQRLSPVQEDYICRWVLLQQKLGSPPTHRQISVLAETILEICKDPLPLGKHWVDGFLRRHPKIKTGRSKRLTRRASMAPQLKLLKNSFTSSTIQSSRRYDKKIVIIWGRRA